MCHKARAARIMRQGVGSGTAGYAAHTCAGVSKSARQVRATPMRLSAMP
jgi:hypothetical protein